jgi:predicted MPP superfamily phosphohydrolase
MQPQRSLEEERELLPSHEHDAPAAPEHELAARELGLAAPRPRGPLSGRRRPWRWHAAAAVLFLQRLLIPPPLRRVLSARLARSLEISRVHVPVARGRLGPAIELAYLSDLHAGFYMSAETLESVAERVVSHAPELICLGGDLIDSRPSELALLAGFLRRLRAPLGVFAVLGNHEHYPARGADACIAFLREHGVEVLVNRGRRVTRSDGPSFWLAGVDDLTESEPDLTAALRGRRPDEPTLLLSHHPDLFIEAATHGVDLQLSGHTHGGQIRILGWQPLVHTRFGLHRGPFRHADTHLYVGRGVGVTVAPLRIDARPEVALVRWGGEG